MLREQNINSQEHKSIIKVILGFAISVILAFISAYIFKFSSILHIPIISNFTYILFNYLYGSFYVFFLSFLILNRIAIFVFRNHLEIKRGLKFGFLLAIIVFAYPFILYINAQRIEANNKLYFEQAHTQGNPALCGKISNESQRNDCYAEIAYQTSGNTDEICNKITPGFERQGCLEVSAKKTSLKSKDLSGCNSLTPDLARNQCISTVAAEMNNIEFCSQISDNILKDNCIGWVVTHQQNVDLYEKYCPAIQDSQSKLNCYYIWASIVHDPSICSKSGLPYRENYSLNNTMPCRKSQP